MPSEIRVTDQKFLYQLRNGDSFTENTSDFTVHLKGNLLEKVKAVFTVQVGWSSDLNNYNLLYNAANQTLRIEAKGNDFRSDGFSVGDDVRLSIAFVALNGVVTSISDGEITLNSVSIIFGALSDGYSLEITGTDILTGLTDKTALKYKFGLIENNEALNTLSKLTNTDQIYLIDSIDHATPNTFSNGESFGNNKAWVTGGVKATFSQRVKGKDYQYPSFLPDLSFQEFIIEHEFIINPFYRDGDLDSISGDEVPPLDIFNGDKSLKYVFDAEFRTEINNPNTALSTEYDTQLGSVGYFDESYNGFKSDFSVDNLQYELAGNSVNQIETSEGTDVTYSIFSSNSNFIDGGYIVLGHASIIESDEYSNSSKEFPELWNDEKIRVQIGSGAVSSGVFINAQANFLGNFRVDVSFRINLSNKVTEEGQNYILYYQAENSNLPPDQSKKVTGLVDLNVYAKNSDINGLWNLQKFEQYPHAEPYDKGVTSGFTNSNGFNETGYFLDASFLKINTAELSALTFEYNIFNTVTNETFTLRSYDFDLSDSFLAGGTQQIEVDETRGYILKDDDLFNGVKIETGANNGALTEYSIQIGYKTPWEKWLEFKKAPKEFFDKNKSLNGFNQKASNYFDNIADFELRVMLRADLLFDGITTQYLTSSESLKVYDYDTDDQNPDAYTCEINTYNENGEVLQNNIIEKDFTRLRALFTPTVPPVFSTSVDMTEVANDYKRFAHGNRTTSGTIATRDGVWANEQANDTDLFTNITGGKLTKNDPSLYTSSQEDIATNDNANAFYGCFSNDEYEFYSISGKMYSNANDNDGLAYNIAFMVDDDGVEHTLSLIATTGGLLLDIDPDYIEGNTGTTTMDLSPAPPFNKVSWALVYNFGKSGCVQLDYFNTNENSVNWSSNNVGDLIFNVNRSSDDIIIDVDWVINGTQYTNTFNYNLNDNDLTKKFKGFNSIGFAFMSQDQGGFKDVELIQPLGDYYGILRIEQEASPSDFGISELSTVREAPENSLLKQSTGNEVKADLQWNGTSFSLQGDIDTSKIKEGQKYEFSAELRLLNLDE